MTGQKDHLITIHNNHVIIPPTEFIARGSEHFIFLTMGWKIYFWSIFYSILQPLLDIITQITKASHKLFFRYPLYSKTKFFSSNNNENDI